MGSVASAVGIAGLWLAAGALAVLTFVVHPEPAPGQLFRAYWPLCPVVAAYAALALVGEGAPDRGEPSCSRAEGP